MRAACPAPRRAPRLADRSRMGPPPQIRRARRPHCMIYSYLPQKSRTQSMATERFSALHREGEDPRSKLYWLDIDATFDDITRQQQIIPGRIARPPPYSLQYSVLHGVGTVANALSVGDKAATFDRFKVDVAALAPIDEESGLPEAHRSARMIWNEMDFRSPRLQIHVQTTMLRHLVELYVTKKSTQSSCR